MSPDNLDHTEAPEAKRCRLEDICNPLPEDQPVSNCLENPVIVRKILAHFNIFELARLSLVNKLWNFEARSLIRNRDKVVARFSARHDLRGPQGCQRITSFLSALENMAVVPYSGLRIYLDGPAHRDVFPPQALLDPCQSLNRLYLKNFTVELSGKFQLDTYSPFFLLTKKLLQNVGGALEKLTLCVPSRFEEFTEKVVQVCSFPRLKVLKLEDGDSNFIETEDAAFTSYVKALVSRCPLLQELHSPGPLDLTTNVLEGSSAALVYKYELMAPFDEVPENFSQELRLEYVRLQYDGPDEFDLDRFNRITPKLLKVSCSKTLVYINMDAVLAVPFMCFGVKLENVEDFELSFNYSHMELVEPRILRFVKDFDFTRLVPNVTEVEIFDSSRPEVLPNHLNAIIARAGAVLKEPLPDRAVNIKYLRLYHSIPDNVRARFFAEMFPSIEKLYIQDGQETCFGSVWEQWAGLNELEVLIECDDALYLNFDSVFCGIFPEEVAELRQKDEEFLRRVNIVPVMPAITCLKSLRRLTLCYKARNVEPILDFLFFDGTFIFSEVTGLVAFARCPDLVVTLKADSGYTLAAMDHLRSYASVGFSSL